MSNSLIGLLGRGFMCEPSRCAEEFKLRKVKNDKLKAEAKAKGEVISTKRQPEGPKL